MNFIIKKFSKDYKASILYRKQYTDKDTYVAFFIKDYIIFTRVEDFQLIFYDKVNLNKSISFTEIYDISYPFSNIE